METSDSLGESKDTEFIDRVNEQPAEEKGSLGKSLDALWMGRILQAQANIESRLGRKYYTMR